MSRSLYYLFPQNRLPEAPRIGQRVRIEGQPGEYVVLRVDMKRFCADLMLTTGNHEIEQNVPYFAIEPVSATEDRENEPDFSAADAESETSAM